MNDKEDDRIAIILFVYFEERNQTSKIKRPPVDRPAAAAYLPIGLTEYFLVMLRRG